MASASSAARRSGTISSLTALAPRGKGLLKPPATGDELLALADQRVSIDDS